MVQMKIIFSINENISFKSYQHGKWKVQLINKPKNF